MKLIGEHPITGGTFADVWKGSIQSVVVATKVVRFFGDSDREIILHVLCCLFCIDYYSLKVCLGVFERSVDMGSTQTSEFTAVLRYVPDGRRKALPCVTVDGIGQYERLS